MAISRKLASALLLVVSFAGLASAAIAKRCPGSDVCFSLNIPDTTVSAGDGHVYLQLTGPTNYSWIALAQGEHMAGAHYFVVYTSKNGNNVTVSQRLAEGHQTPHYSNNTSVTLLEGSGVQNGTMIANIKCANCNTWSGGSIDLKASSTSWIWAYSAGPPLSTDDTSVHIKKHDEHGGLSFDTTAQGGSDSNPFLNLPQNGLPASGAGGHASVFHGAPKRVVRMYTAHAICACLAWAAIFPIGGIMIRLLSFTNLLWVHAGLQISGYCLYIVAVGLGIELSINPRFWRMDNKHVIIGLIIFGLFFVQMFTGYLHHYFFKKINGRHVCSYIHLWSGRLCIPLGMVNAGFGFQITHKTMDNWQVKVYTVFAVIIFVCYVASIVLGETRRKKQLAARAVITSDASSGSGTHTPAVRQTVYTGNDGEKEVAIA
ncbi:CBD9-like protein [Polyplosphaeria fusca]|uniref:CBD9-like protein n=1 Tax=Polyplosphaeria fusca TaxID=682080 RepID=A0A9P4V5A2_9PLEO|nr:CBD9-like protein [Polyplosphaeria fusca]